MNSTHKVEVVPIKLENHPNANSLSIVRIYGYQVCVRTADWVDKTLGAYLPPDSVASDLPVFDFLGKDRRIRSKKLRGIISFGLLVPAPEGSNVGDDVAELLGVTHYEPPLKTGSLGPNRSGTTSGEAESPPPVYAPKYDLESCRRYNHVFNEDEPVFVSEKCHGANSRYWYDSVNNRMYCGSRTEWKKYDPNNLWWKGLVNTPKLEQFCKEHPELVVYGELIGPVQDIRYNLNEVTFVAFDLLSRDGWINALEAREIGKDLPWVPTIVESIPFNYEKLCELAEGKSFFPGYEGIKEGIVVKPLVERSNWEIGRVCLKLVGNDYYNRKTEVDITPKD